MSKRDKNTSLCSQSKSAQCKNCYKQLIRRQEHEEKEQRRVPASCRHCPNYRPEFKYRYCLFARCPYEMYRQIFRRKPLARDLFSGSEVVKMRV